MNKTSFLENLKLQFEEEEMSNLLFDTKFKDLDTWDSLTKFSIIAFVADDYNVKITDFSKIETVSQLYEFILSNNK